MPGQVPARCPAREGSLWPPPSTSCSPGGWPWVASPTRLPRAATGLSETRLPSPCPDALTVCSPDAGPAGHSSHSGPTPCRLPGPRQVTALGLCQRKGVPASHLQGCHENKKHPTGPSPLRASPCAPPGHGDQPPSRRWGGGGGVAACRAGLEAGHAHSGHPDARGITTPVKPSTPVLGGSAHRGQEPSGRSACEERITGSVSEDQTPEGPPSLLVGFHALTLVTADERLLLISTLLTASPTAPPSVASGFTQTHGCHGSGERWPRSRIRRRDAGRGPHCPRGSAEHWAEH